MNFSAIVLSFTLGFGILLTTSLGNADWCFTDNGVENYDKGNALCCNGMISRRLPSQECCGDELIDMNKYVCCGEKASPRFVISPIDGKRWEQTCCGSHAIFGDNSGCCYDSPVNLTEEQSHNRDYLDCCSKGVIADTRTQMCCGGKALNLDGKTGCCAGEPFDKRYNWCGKKIGQEVKLRVDQRICYDQIYSVIKSSCCSGVLNETIPENDPNNWSLANPKFDCCGKEVMDPTTKHCCSAQYPEFKTHSIPKGPSFKCCGNGFYDTSCQACLNDQAVVKNPEQEECGSNLINKTQEGCCAMHMPYNKSSHWCCLGSFSSVISINEKCCNGAGVGKDQLCCNKIKPCTKTNDDDNDCCFNELKGEARTFNTMKQKCVDGEVFTVAPDKEVCGNQEYDPQTHICCKGITSRGIKFKLESLSSGNNQCCGVHPFNNNSQSCCYGKLFDIPAQEARCCFIDYKAYTYRDPSSPCTRPCLGGSSYYDVIKDICCDGVAHRKKNDHNCCGPYYFRIKDKGSSEDRVSQRRKKNSRKYRKLFACCNNKDIFSKKTSVCLNGEVQSRRKALTDTQGVCHRHLWRSVDGVAKHACTSQYALIGRLKKIKIKRRAFPDTALLEMKLIRIRTMQIGIKSHSVAPRKLTLKVHVPIEKSIKCSSDMINGHKNKKVAVFFNAPITDKNVTIDLQDSLRIVRYKLFHKLSKFGVSKAFCKTKYSNDLQKSNI